MKLGYNDGWDKLLRMSLDLNLHHFENSEMKSFVTKLYRCLPQPNHPPDKNIRTHFDNLTSILKNYLDNNDIKEFFHKVVELPMSTHSY